MLDVLDGFDALDPGDKTWRAVEPVELVQPVESGRCDVRAGTMGNVIFFQNEARTRSRPHISCLGQRYNNHTARLGAQGEPGWNGPGAGDALLLTQPVPARRERALVPGAVMRGV